MSNNITDLRSHAFKKGEPILIDTNVWMATHGPVALHDWRTTIYSNSLKQMRTYNCNIYVNDMVLAEFVNAFSRYEYNTLPKAKRPTEFKIFRNSTAYKPIAEEISINVRKILKISKKCGGCFESIDIDTLVSEFATGKYDFNDIVLEEVCKLKGLKLLTHDGDFSGKGIDILTANNKLRLT